MKIIIIKNIGFAEQTLITFGYLFVGANIAYQGIFQALGYGVSSLVVSLLRLIIIPLPLAMILLNVQDVEKIIWIVFPIGELVAFIISLMLMKGISKLKIEVIK